MEPTKHILYDNWRYYKLKTGEICDELEAQDKIISVVDLMDVNGDEANHIYYKRDCLLFELHRRAFRNCLYQMYSVHKAKSWIRCFDPEKRCACCHYEYYEYMADLTKTGVKNLEMYDSFYSLVMVDTFEEGKALDRPTGNFVPAIPLLCVNIPKKIISSKNCESDKKKEIPICAPRKSKHVSFSSNDLGEEQKYLVHKSKENINSDDYISDDSDSDFDGSPGCDLNSKKKIKKTFKSRFFSALPIAKPRTRYRNDAGPSSSYQKLKEEKPSKVNSNKAPKKDKSEEPKSNPLWFFASVFK